MFGIVLDRSLTLDSIKSCAWFMEWKHLIWCLKWQTICVQRNRETKSSSKIILNMLTLDRWLFKNFFWIKKFSYISKQTWKRNDNNKESRKHYYDHKRVNNTSFEQETYKRQKIQFQSSNTPNFISHEWYQLPTTSSLKHHYCSCP